MEVFADLKSNGGTFNGYIQNTDIPRFPSFRFPLIKIHCIVECAICLTLILKSTPGIDQILILYHITHWSKLTLIPFLILRTFDHSGRWEMIKEF